MLPAPDEQEHCQFSTLKIMMAWLLQHLLKQHCAFDSYLFWSADRDRVFMKVRAPFETLGGLAERFAMLLQLDPKLDPGHMPAYVPYVARPSLSYMWQRYVITDGPC